MVDNNEILFQVPEQPHCYCELGYPNLDGRYEHIKSQLGAVLGSRAGSQLFYDDPIFYIWWLRYAQRVGWPFSFAVSKADFGVERVLNQLGLEVSPESVSVLRKANLEYFDERADSAVAELFASSKIQSVMLDVDCFHLWQVEALASLSFLTPGLLVEIVIAGLGGEICHQISNQLHEFYIENTQDCLAELAEIQSVSELKVLLSQPSYFNSIS